MTTTIKPITLEITANTWKLFKDIVPRSETLNERLVTLIEKDILEANKEREGRGNAPSPRAPLKPLRPSPLFCKAHNLSYRNGCPRCAKGD